MGNKPAKQVEQTYTVHIRVAGEVSVDVPATTLEQAIELARQYGFNDVVGQPFDDLSVETEVTGVFKNA